MKYSYIMIVLFITLFLFSELITMFRKIKEPKEIKKNKKNDVKGYIIKSFASLWELTIFLFKEILKFLKNENNAK